MTKRKAKKNQLHIVYTYDMSDLKLAAAAAAVRCRGWLKKSVNTPLKPVFRTTYSFCAAIIIVPHPHKIILDK